MHLQERLDFGVVTSHEAIGKMAKPRISQSRMSSRAIYYNTA
jgi:hypothetical protein